jgi:protoporphyrinogen/coproporphyrinogen III oxidase
MIDVIVIGGGISGLTAAYDLARAGRRVRLVEQRTRLGGLVWTEHVDGITIEAGPDALLMQKPSAAALCDELGLSLVPTQPPRIAFVLRHGRLIAIPPASVLGVPIAWRSIIAAEMLSPAGRARLARDLIYPASPSSRDDDQSVGAFIRRRFGDEAVRYLAQPLLGGIHAGDVDRLSLRALFPALADADTEPGSVIRTLAARRKAADPDGAFKSIATGLGDLIAALVRHLPSDAIVAGTGAARLDAPDATSSLFTVHLSSGEALQAPAIVLALPAYAIAELVLPFDRALADLCLGISYASSASITLAYRRTAMNRPFLGQGFVVPRGERETRLLAVSFVTSKWVGRAPDDVIMLRAFAGGTLDADLLERDDHELADLAHADLATLLDLREPPYLRRVYRWWRAGPQYEVGHLTRVASIEQRVAQHAGLFLTGSAFRGVGIPDNVSDARRVAAEVETWLDARSAAKMGV